MSKSDLTIITVAANESGFLDLMIKSVHAFTYPKPNIIICDNGNNGSYLKKYEQYDNVVVIKNKRARKFKMNKQFLNTSTRHGLGLNVIFKLVTTKYTAIIEPDCVVLNYGWDNIPDGYQMNACKKGTGIGGENYYYPCFMIFYTEYLNYNGRMSFLSNNRPEGVGKGIPIVKNEMGKFKRYSDVGWQVYTKIPNDKVNILKFARWNNKASKRFYKKFSHKTNVFIDQNNDIVAAHFWRGSEISRRKDYRGLSVAGQKGMWFSVVKKCLADGYG